MGETFLLTTHPGLEHVVREEAAGIGIQTEPAPERGWVYAHGSLRLLPRLRSIHHIIRIHREAMFDGTLTNLLRTLRETSFSWKQITFRVTAERSGKHPFTSMDVQREAGKVLLELHPSWQVRLTDWDVEIIILIRETRLLIGQRLTRRSLGRRYEKAYWGRASLQPPVAYALVHEAYSILKDNVLRILDPVAGSGTLLFEAFHMWPWAHVYGTDTSKKAIQGLKENAARFGIPLQSLQASICDLEEHFPPDFFDLILADPPYGVRMTRTNAVRLGHELAQKATRLLRPGGVLVSITPRSAAYAKAFTQYGFLLRKQYRIEMGGLWPAIMVFQKPGGG